MRRLLLAAVALVVLLVVADRVAVAAAQRDIARRVQHDQHLGSRPSVSIGGFPFLTQLISGTYDDVTVSVDDVRVGALQVSMFDAHLVGAHVSFGDVVSQHISRVPVDRASAELVLTYADLNTWLRPRHLHLGPASGGKVRVTASGSVASASAAASGPGRLSVQGDTVTITAGPGLDIQIPLPGLPFRMRLNAVKATQEGVVVSGFADALVLRP
jgi:hypothetical protein